MKKLFKMALVAVLALSLVACTSSTDEPAPTGSTATTGETSSVKIGFVTDTGGIDDKSFNQTSYEGIRKFASEAGLVEGAFEDGGNFTYLQSGNEADYVPNLSAFGEQGANLVAAAGYLFQSAVEEVAAAYPDVNFVAIDVAPIDLPNVQTANFMVNEGSYLVGVAAGTKAIENGSNHVGMVIGGESASMNMFWAGYQEGVWSVCPECTISYDNANSYTDSALGKTLAQKQYNAGATVIFACAGGTGNGIIQEAAERRTNGEDVWVIGVDTDQYSLGTYGDGSQSCVLTSMLKRVDTATYNASKQVAEGNFQGGNIDYTLADEGVGIPAENPNLTESDLAAIEEAREAIISGEVTVSTEPQTSETNPLIIG